MRPEASTILVPSFESLLAFLQLFLMLTSESLSTVFNRYADRPFVFVRPGGNAGDHLIWHGGAKLGRMCGLDAKTLEHDAFMETTLSPDTVVYIHGGGGYNPWWSGKPMDEFEKAVMSHSGVVIQGPQTCHPDKAFLQERVVDRIQNPQAEKVYMFCRERYSHEIMKSVLPGWVELGLDHDTALNLEPSDLTPYEVASYTLYVIRRDKEAPGESAMDLMAPWMDPGHRHAEVRGLAACSCACSPHRKQPASFRHCRLDSWETNDDHRQQLHEEPGGMGILTSAARSGVAR